MHELRLRESTQRGGARGTLSILTAHTTTPAFPSVLQSGKSGLRERHYEHHRSNHNLMPPHREDGG